METSYHTSLTSYYHYTELYRSYMLRSENVDDNYFTIGKTHERAANEALEQAVSECLIFLKSHPPSSYSNFLLKEFEAVKTGESSLLKVFFLINLIWQKPSDSISKALSTMLMYLISREDYGKVDYYIESFLDIWNYHLPSLIPIEILEAVCLKEEISTLPVYGAYIKAASYLKDHPVETQAVVLDKMRSTKMYREDSYYREWVD